MSKECDAYSCGGAKVKYSLKIPESCIDIENEIKIEKFNLLYPINQLPEIFIVFTITVKTLPRNTNRHTSIKYNTVRIY